MIRGVTPNNNWHQGLSRIIIFVQFIKTLFKRSIHLHFLKTLRMFPEKNYVIWHLSWVKYRQHSK